MTGNKSTVSYQPYDVGKPSIFIQWKNTDACFDFYCDCRESDHDGHFDGFFANYVRCGYCKRVFELPHNLKLVEVTDPEHWGHVGAKDVDISD